MIKTLHSLIVNFALFLQTIYRHRAMLWAMTKQDLKSVYLGSYLGFVWSFIHPIIISLVLWVVFQMGFKTGPVLDAPFVLWLLCGLYPWFFFSEALINATNSVRQYDFLVKKMVFRVSFLPLIKIISSLLIHLFFILVILCFMAAYARIPHIHFIQIVYYLFCQIILLTGIGWLTSAINVFLKDTAQFITVLLSIGFWAMPILWDLSMIPDRFRILIKLNPVFYIINGYRETFLYHVWFWHHWQWTLYFWSVTGLLFVIGALIFNRLRIHFADVL
jgi:lipopolysaccharide transport system permease protein/teichoic acid transport system permease protein